MGWVHGGAGATGRTTGESACPSQHCTDHPRGVPSGGGRDGPWADPARLGGTLVCAAQHLKRYYDPEDLFGEEWQLNDEEIAALDLQGAASPMEVEGELPDMNAEEMAKEGFYLVKSVLRHRYCQGWSFLTLWEGFGVEEATWEPFSAFVLPEGRLNSVLVDYLSQNNLGELLRLAETLASKTKARD